MEEEILDSGEFLNKNATDFRQAENGLRFINYIIDYFIVLLLVLILTFVFGSFVGMFFFSTIGTYVFTWTIFTLYYVLSEHFLNGKTLGKMLTKTRAVSITNERMPLKSIILRSLSRLVPFEAFSFFSSTPGGWHDKWSDTMVIKE